MQLQNNYCYILPGLPNYGIAPGCLFILQGVNFSSQPLSPLQSSATPGLPLALNGTGISVTVNGVTTHPAIYYTSPGQLGVVLPSTTPIGTGTITVTNGSTLSATSPIQVVSSAVGLDSLHGSGTGAAVATAANGNTFNTINSAMPGETIILWGSGVGADTANDDRTFRQQQNNLINIPLQVYIGGIQANVVYRGRSQYPGVDQINVVVPPSVQLGCFVSVVAVSGTMVSNFVTLPVASVGGVCTDPGLGIGTAQAQLLNSKGTVKFGTISGGPGGGGADFESFPNGQFAIYFGSPTLKPYNGGLGAVSSGSCVVSPPVPPSGLAYQFQSIGLDAGSITMTWKSGSQVLPREPYNEGYYSPPTTSTLPSGTSLTFDSGAGGTDIGHFNTTVTIPAPPTLTVQNAPTTIQQAQGLTVTWTGGSPGSYVQIGGSSSTYSTVGWSVYFSYYCLAHVEDGQFTIPPSILLVLPSSTFSVGLSISTAPVVFTASGLDWGFANASNSSYDGTTISLQ